MYGAAVSVNRVNELECRCAECGALTKEGRREKVEGAVGVAGGGGPGSTPATQAEIAVIVLLLEPRREMVRAVGVGGRSADG